MNELDKWIPLGRMALRIGLLEGQLRRMCNRNEVPFRMFYGVRMFNIDDIPALLAAASSRGYIKPEPAAA